MCVFSDTQLENVFVLPRYDEYREYLEQIFKVMGVRPEQVIMIMKAVRICCCSIQVVYL
jgi:hypothetical protein